MFRSASSAKICVKFEPEKWRPHLCKTCLRSLEQHNVKAYERNEIFNFFVSKKFIRFKCSYLSVISHIALFRCNSKAAFDYSKVPTEPFPISELPDEIIELILVETALKSVKKLFQVLLLQRNPSWKKLATNAAKTCSSLTFPMREDERVEEVFGRKPDYLKRLWDQHNSLPLWECETCGYRVCGLRCCGYRTPDIIETWIVDEDYRGCSLLTLGGKFVHVSIFIANYSYSVFVGTRKAPHAMPDIPTPTGCGQLLYFDTCTETVRCPTHSESSVLTRCNCPPYFTIVAPKSLPPSITRADIERALAPVKPYVSDISPMTTCSTCGWSIEGMLCAREGAHSKPVSIPRDGFFERVWCSYVWTCEGDCPGAGKGTFATGSCFCDCKGPTVYRGSEVPGSFMHVVNYEERHLPPFN
jgi:hypothetical protein